MNRAELIRSHFEAMRDLTWAETIALRLKEQQLTPDQLAVQREQWNRHAEQRDWPWWQVEARGYTEGELAGMRADCIEELTMFERSLKPDGSLARMRAELQRAAKKPPSGPEAAKSRRELGR